ncbi:hypothetical protein [Mesorhizobium sp. M0488]|uniref:hypothetical protein n=1 Tax=unclassified Mesorhizobium TaxID=325217 RepID=UPI00333907FF
MTIRACATCETLTPGRSLSIAMARFCSSLKKRRAGAASSFVATVKLNSEGVALALGLA